MVDSKPELLDPLASTQEGTKVTLECKWSEQTGYTRVSWFRNGNPVFSTKDMSVTQTRSKCFLTIHRANSDHNGEYKCQASNSHGKTSTQCTVNVLPAFQVGLRKRLPGRGNKIGQLNGSAKKFEVATKDPSKSSITISPGLKLKSQVTPANKQQESPSANTTKPDGLFTKQTTQKTAPAAEETAPSGGRDALTSARLRLKRADTTPIHSSTFKVQLKGSTPPPAFKPVQIEVAIPAHTAIQSHSTPASSPGSRAAAVALLSNKLQAVQAKDNAYTSDMRRSGSQPQSKESTPPPQSALKHSPIKCTAASKLSSSISVDTPVYDSTTHLHKAGGSGSSSSSTSDISSSETANKQPAMGRRLSGSPSIRDRLAKFSSSEELVIKTPPSVKRTAGEVSSARSTQSNDTHPDSGAGSGDQSYDSSDDTGQSFHSLPSIDPISLFDSQSEGTADVEFESCVSSFSGTDQSLRSSFESLETLEQEDSFGSRSFHSLSSRAESSITLKSDSFDSTHSLGNYSPPSTSLPSLHETESTTARRQSVDRAVIAPDIIDHTLLYSPTSADAFSASSAAQDAQKQHSDKLLESARQPITSQKDAEFVARDNLLITPAPRLAEDGIIQVEQAHQDNSSPPLELNSSLAIKCLEGEHQENLETPADSYSTPTDPSTIAMSDASSDTASVSSGSLSPQPDIEQKPVLGSGRIAALSKSFETNSDSEATPVMRTKPRRVSKSSTVDSSQWENKTPDNNSNTEPRPLSQSSTQRRSRLAEKLAMFNNSSNAPMEFGVHITTTKNLDELTKHAKNIYISKEEMKRQQAKQEEEQQAAKVTTQLSPMSYQSTVKVETDQSVSCVRRYDDEGSVSFESFDWSMDQEFQDEELFPLVESDSNKLFVDIHESSMGEVAPDLVRGLEHYYHADAQQAEALSVDLYETMSDSSSLSDRSARRQNDDITTEGGFTTADEAILSSECEDDYLMPTSGPVTNQPHIHRDEQWSDIDNESNKDNIGNYGPSATQTNQPPLRQDSTDTYLADNSEELADNQSNTNQPTTQSEMSQAARISNFLENFARTSSESMDSLTPSLGSPSQEKADFVDAVTLVVPQRAPRLDALSREGSVRSSFEIYKIKEESVESDENDTDSPRSHKHTHKGETNPEDPTIDDETVRLSPAETKSLVCDLPDDADNAGSSFTETWIQNLDTDTNQSQDLLSEGYEISQESDLHIPHTESQDHVLSHVTSNKIILDKNSESESDLFTNPDVSSVTDRAMSSAESGLVSPKSHDKVVSESDDVFESSDSSSVVVESKPVLSSLDVPSPSRTDEGFNSFSEFPDTMLNNKTEISGNEVMVSQSVMQVESHSMHLVPQTLIAEDSILAEKAAATDAKPSDPELFSPISDRGFHDDSGYVDQSMNTTQDVDLSVNPLDIDNGTADEDCSQQIIPNLANQEISQSLTDANILGITSENQHTDSLISQCSVEEANIIEREIISIIDEATVSFAEAENVDLIHEPALCDDRLISFTEAHVTNRNIQAEESEEIYIESSDEDTDILQIIPVHVNIPVLSANETRVINCSDFATADTIPDQQANGLSIPDLVSDTIEGVICSEFSQADLFLQPTTFQCGTIALSQHAFALAVSVESLDSRADDSSHSPHSPPSSERATSVCESSDELGDYQGSQSYLHSKASRNSVPETSKTTPDEHVLVVEETISPSQTAPVFQNASVTDLTDGMTANVRQDVNNHIKVQCVNLECINNDAFSCADNDKPILEIVAIDTEINQLEITPTQTQVCQDQDDSFVAQPGTQAKLEKADAQTINEPLTLTHSPATYVLSHVDISTPNLIGSHESGTFCVSSDHAEQQSKPEQTTHLNGSKTERADNSQIPSTTYVLSYAAVSTPNPTDSHESGIFCVSSDQAEQQAQPNQTTHLDYSKEEVADNSQAPSPTYVLSYAAVSTPNPTDSNESGIFRVSSDYAAQQTQPQQMTHLDDSKMKRAENFQIPSPTYVLSHAVVSTPNPTNSHESRIFHVSPDHAAQQAQPERRTYLDYSKVERADRSQISSHTYLSDTNMEMSACEPNSDSHSHINEKSYGEHIDLESLFANAVIFCETSTLMTESFTSTEQDSCEYLSAASSVHSIMSTSETESFDTADTYDLDILKTDGRTTPICDDLKSHSSGLGLSSILKTDDNRMVTSAQSGKQTARLQPVTQRIPRTTDDRTPTLFYADLKFQLLQDQIKTQSATMPTSTDSIKGTSDTSISHTNQHSMVSDKTDIDTPVNSSHTYNLDDPYDMGIKVKPDQEAQTAPAKLLINSETRGKVKTKEQKTIPTSPSSDPANASSEEVIIDTGGADIEVPVIQPAENVGYADVEYESQPAIIQPAPEPCEYDSIGPSIQEVTESVSGSVSAHSKESQGSHVTSTSGEPSWDIITDSVAIEDVQLYEDPIRSDISEISTGEVSIDITVPAETIKEIELVQERTTQVQTMHMQSPAQSNLIKVSVSNSETQDEITIGAYEASDDDEYLEHLASEYSATSPVRANEDCEAQHHSQATSAADNRNSAPVFVEPMSIANLGNSNRNAAPIFVEPMSIANLGNSEIEAQYIEQHHEMKAPNKDITKEAAEADLQDANKTLTPTTTNSNSVPLFVTPMSVTDLPQSESAPMFVEPMIIVDEQITPKYNDNLNRKSTETVPPQVEVTADSVTKYPQAESIPTVKEQRIKESIHLKPTISSDNRSPRQFYADLRHKLLQEELLLSAPSVTCATAHQESGYASGANRTTALSTEKDMSGSEYLQGVDQENIDQSINQKSAAQKQNLILQTTNSPFHIQKDTYQQVSHETRVKAITEIHQADNHESNIEDLASNETVTTRLERSACAPAVLQNITTADDVEHFTEAEVSVSDHSTTLHSESVDISEYVPVISDPCLKALEFHETDVILTATFVNKAEENQIPSAAQPVDQALTNETDEVALSTLDTAAFNSTESLPVEVPCQTVSILSGGDALSEAAHEEERRTPNSSFLDVNEQAATNHSTHSPQTVSSSNGNTNSAQSSARLTEAQHSTKLTTETDDVAMAAACDSTETVPAEPLAHVDVPIAEHKDSDVASAALPGEPCLSDDGMPPALPDGVGLSEAKDEEQITPNSSLLDGNAISYSASPSNKDKNSFPLVVAPPNVLDMQQSDSTPPFVKPMIIVDEQITSKYHDDRDCQPSTAAAYDTEIAHTNSPIPNASPIKRPTTETTPMVQDQRVQELGHLQPTHSNDHRSPRQFYADLRYKLLQEDLHISQKSDPATGPSPDIPTSPPKSDTINEMNATITISEEAEPNRYDIVKDFGSVDEQNSSRRMDKNVAAKEHKSSLDTSADHTVCRETQGKVTTKIYRADILESMSYTTSAHQEAVDIQVTSASLECELTVLQGNKTVVDRETPRVTEVSASDHSPISHPDLTDLHAKDISNPCLGNVEHSETKEMMKQEGSKRISEAQHTAKLTTETEDVALTAASDSTVTLPVGPLVNVAEIPIVEHNHSDVALATLPCTDGISEDEMPSALSVPMLSDSVVVTEAQDNEQIDSTSSILDANEKTASNLSAHCPHTVSPSNEEKNSAPLFVTPMSITDLQRSKSVPMSDKSISIVDEKAASKQHDNQDCEPSTAALYDTEDAHTKSLISAESLAKSPTTKATPQRVKELSHLQPTHSNDHRSPRQFYADLRYKLLQDDLIISPKSVTATGPPPDIPTSPPESSHVSEMNAITTISVETDLSRSDIANDFAKEQKSSPDTSGPTSNNHGRTVKTVSHETQGKVTTKIYQADVLEPTSRPISISHEPVDIKVTSASLECELTVLQGNKTLDDRETSTETEISASDHSLLSQPELTDLHVEDISNRCLGNVETYETEEMLSVTFAHKQEENERFSETQHSAELTNETHDVPMTAALDSTESVPAEPLVPVAEVPIVEYNPSDVASTTLPGQDDIYDDEKRALDLPILSDSVALTEVQDEEQTTPFSSLLDVNEQTASNLSAHCLPVVSPSSEDKNTAPLFVTPISVTDLQQGKSAPMFVEPMSIVDERNASKYNYDQDCQHSAAVADDNEILHTKSPIYTEMAKYPITKTTPAEKDKRLRESSHLQTTHSNDHRSPRQFYADLRYKLLQEELHISQESVAATVPPPNIPTSQPESVHVSEMNTTTTISVETDLNRLGMDHRVLHETQDKVITKVYQAELLEPMSEHISVYKEAVDIHVQVTSANIECDLTVLQGNKMDDEESSIATEVSASDHSLLSQPELTDLHMEDISNRCLGNVETYETEEMLSATFLKNQEENKRISAAQHSVETGYGAATAASHSTEGVSAESLVHIAELPNEEYKHSDVSNISDNDALPQTTALIVTDSSHLPEAGNEGKITPNLSPVLDFNVQAPSNENKNSVPLFVTPMSVTDSQQRKSVPMFVEPMSIVDEQITSRDHDGQDCKSSAVVSNASLAKYPTSESAPAMTGQQVVVSNRLQTTQSGDSRSPRQFYADLRYKLLKEELQISSETSDTVQKETQSSSESGQDNEIGRWIEAEQSSMAKDLALLGEQQSSQSLDHLGLSHSQREADISMSYETQGKITTRIHQTDILELAAEPTFALHEAVKTDMASTHIECELTVLQDKTTVDGRKSAMEPELSATDNSLAAECGQTEIHSDEYEDLKASTGPPLENAGFHENLAATLVRNEQQNIKSSATQDSEDIVASTNDVALPSSDTAALDTAEDKLSESFAHIADNSLKEPIVDKILTNAPFAELLLESQTPGCKPDVTEQTPTPQLVSKKSAPLFIAPLSVADLQLSSESHTDQVDQVTSNLPLEPEAPSLSTGYHSTSSATPYGQLPASKPHTLIYKSTERSTDHRSPREFYADLRYKLLQDSLQGDQQVKPSGKDEIEDISKIDKPPSKPDLTSTLDHMDCEISNQRSNPVIDGSSPMPRLSDNTSAALVENDTQVLGVKDVEAHYLKEVQTRTEGFIETTSAQQDVKVCDKKQTKEILGEQKYDLVESKESLPSNEIQLSSRDRTTSALSHQNTAPMFVAPLTIDDTQKMSVLQEPEHQISNTSPTAETTKDDSDVKDAYADILSRTSDVVESKEKLFNHEIQPSSMERTTSALSHQNIPPLFVSPLTIDETQKTSVIQEPNPKISHTPPTAETTMDDSGANNTDGDVLERISDVVESKDNLLSKEIQPSGRDRTTSTLSHHNTAPMFVAPLTIDETQKTSVIEEPEQKVSYTASAAATTMDDSAANDEDADVLARTSDSVLHVTPTKNAAEQKLAQKLSVTSNKYPLDGRSPKEFYADIRYTILLDSIPDVQKTEKVETNTGLSAVSSIQEQGPAIIEPVAPDTNQSGEITLKTENATESLHIVEEFEVSSDESEWELVVEFSDDEQDCQVARSKHPALVRQDAEDYDQVTFYLEKQESDDSIYDEDVFSSDQESSSEVTGRSAPSFITSFKTTPTPSDDLLNAAISSQDHKTTESVDAQIQAIDSIPDFTAPKFVTPLEGTPSLPDVIDTSQSDQVNNPESYAYPRFLSSFETVSDSTALKPPETTPCDTTETTPCDTTETTPSDTTDSYSIDSPESIKSIASSSSLSDTETVYDVDEWAAIKNKELSESMEGDLEPTFSDIEVAEVVFPPSHHIDIKSVPADCKIVENPSVSNEKTSGPSLIPFPRDTRTPREVYADIRLSILNIGPATRSLPAAAPPSDNNISSKADQPGNERLRALREKLGSNSGGQKPAWKAALNNNNNLPEKIKREEPEGSMKLKVTNYSAGLKSSSLRTSVPVFTTKLRNHYGRQGDSFKLQCRVDGEPKPVISWLKEGKPLLGSSRIKCYESNGSQILEVTNSTKEDSGRYTVKALNSKGDTHCSADVEIAGKKTTEPKTSSKAITESFRAGDSHTMVSEELNKQVDDFHMEAAAMMSELESLTPRSRVITNGHMTHSHSGHHHSHHNVAPPSFTVKLKECQVEEGERLDLECTTQGDDSAGLDHSPPQFVKILHDQVVDEGDSVTIECKNPHDDDHGMIGRAPQFTQKLEDHEVNEGDSLTIEVRGSHDYHHAAPPRFVQELQDEEVIEGESVTIECRSPHHASSTGAPVFVEKLHDLEVEEGDQLTLECQSPYSKISTDTKCTAPSFITKLQDDEVEEGDSLTIECRGPNDHPHSHSYTTQYSPQHSPSPQKKQQSPGRTSVQAPKFVQKLEDQELDEGDSLTIECKKSSEAITPPKFVKELENTELHEGDSLLIECSQVSPKASSNIPSSTDDSAISVQSSQPPSITQELSDVTVTVGGQAELVLQTSGSLPMDIVWVHNEDELNPEDPDYIQVSEGNTHRLLITAAFPEDSGTYICEAYNDAGEADTACELTVVEEVAAEPEGPIDDTTPVVLESIQESMIISDGSSVELSCRIANVTADDVSWTKNGRMARKGSRFKTECIGDRYSYSISNCMSIDKGLYRVTASTKYGEVYSECDITYSTDRFASTTASKSGQSKSSNRSSMADEATIPKFSKSLSDVTVTELEKTILECKVDATPKPAVSWQCNGKDLKAGGQYEMSYEAGVAKLTLRETYLADQGRYTATATNSAGSEKTSCFLNVQKPIPKPTGSPPDCPAGKPTAVDISSTGATLTWQGPSYDGGSMIEGFRVEMCKVSLLSISQSGYWRTLHDLCKSTSYRVTQMNAGNEYVFRVKAINAVGEGPPGELSDPVLATDRRESIKSISTLADSESVDYSEYSDYPESEYDPDLDEAFLDHDVLISNDRKLDEHYDVVQELGKGKFGAVFLVTEKSTQRQWAAKKIKCRSSQKADIMNEVDVMNTLRHPKLVRLWEVLDHGREMVLIQEYVGGGELFERIVDDDFDLKESDCVRFMKQICDGIGYMHTKSIVHLDLKPENVMCVSKLSNQIKLIDFGLARKHKPGESMKVMFGTPEFVAPEVINYDPVGFNTDMWSIGVITYVLLSGLSPFMGDNDNETLSNVTSVEWDFEDEAFDEISEAAKEFISNLLVKNKDHRLGAADALKHSWLVEQGKKDGQTLSKSKSKMKKFLARRKWQKTGKAILAITRMRSSFLKLNSMSSIDTTMLSPSPTSPPHPASISEEPDVFTPVIPREDKKFVSTPEGDTTPTGDVFINNYPTPQSSPGRGDDKKFVSVTSETGSEDDIKSPQPSRDPSMDKDQMSDTKDSGYGGRKSTREILPEEDETEGCAEGQPVFVTSFPDESHVIEGDSARFDVVLQSSAGLAVSWYKDSERLTESGRVEFDEEEGGKYALIIRDVRGTDDAEYECRVRNDFGQNSCFGELYVVQDDS